MKRPILLIGGGGHCVSCIEIIESIGDWSIAGIIDVRERVGQMILEYRIIGSDEDLASLSKFRYATIAVGQLKTSAVRERVFGVALDAGFDFPVLASPTAAVSRHAVIGRGTMVFHHATVNGGARVGENCILNTGSIVEHDAIIGDFSHVSTGALVNGGCIVGRGCFVGSGAVLKHGVRLGDGVVLGAGSVAIRDIQDPGVYVGNPARKLG